MQLQISALIQCHIQDFQGGPNNPVVLRTLVLLWSRYSRLLLASLWIQVVLGVPAGGRTQTGSNTLIAYTEVQWQFEKQYSQEFHRFQRTQEHQSFPSEEKGFMQSHTADLFSYIRI